MGAMKRGILDAIAWDRRATDAHADALFGAPDWRASVR